MKRNVLKTLVLLGVSLPFIVACTPSSSSSAESTSTGKPSTSEIKDESFTVTDVKGRELKFEKPASKALCLGAGSLRLYSYVGDMNKLVAVEDYDKPAEGKTLRPYQLAYKDILSSLPTCGKGGPGAPGFDPEIILGLQPDVIFACDKRDAGFLNDMSNKIKVPICAIDYGKNNVFDKGDKTPFKTSLYTISKIMGCEEKFTNLNAFIDKSVKNLDDLTKDIVDANKKSVYFGGTGKSKKSGIECSQQNHPLLNAIHANNILDGQEFNFDAGTLQIDMEFLARLNPDIVVIEYEGYAKVEEQMATPAIAKKFSNWSALKEENRTYVALPYRDYNVQPECALVNAMFVASIAFKNTDIKFDSSFGQEVFEAFYGKDVYNAYTSTGRISELSFKSVTF